MKNSLHFSPTESSRFGMNVYRASISEVKSADLRGQILSEEIDLAVVRIDAASKDLGKLFQLGFPAIQADTLVYYHLSLAGYTPKPLRNKDLSFTPLTLDERELSDDLVSTIFAEYTNHYNANPYLDKSDIVAGYQEWVGNYVDPLNKDKVCYKVEKNGQVVGFATVLIEGEEAEGVLYGVLPQFSGLGIYSDIIRFTQSAAKAMGCIRMKVSTQVQNYAVQKVWSREGFVLQEAYATVHINAMLSYSQNKADTFSFSTTNEEIEQFAAISGDYNPIHLKDDVAREKSFKSRIAHGLKPNAVLSKYYSTVFKDQTCLFLRYNYLFGGPIYAGTAYNVEVSIVHHDPQTNIYESVAKIKDEEGKTVIVAYNTLKTC